MCAYTQKSHLINPRKIQATQDVFVASQKQIKMLQKYIKKRQANASIIPLKCQNDPFERIYFMLLPNDKPKSYQHTRKNISPWRTFALSIQSTDKESEQQDENIMYSDQ